MRISTVRHPEYTDDCFDWHKWRLTYKGGRHFIEHYLEKFSKREDDTAFKSRRKISYNPAHAKKAINKLKNTFYSRMSEIRRMGGPPSYQEAIQGKGGGVDMYGSSMNSFMGQEVLHELMVMKKVGIFVDKPNLDGNLLARNFGKKPYLYIYKAEDIYTWDYIYAEGELVYTNVLLRDCNYTYDQSNGLVAGTEEFFRHMWIGQDGKVHIQMWKAAEDNNAEEDVRVGEEIVLDLPRLPFVMLGLQDSLLADAADYQIAMLNLASADVSYVFKANFPVYVEQFDPAAESVYMRRPRPALPSNTDKHTGQDPTAGTHDEGLVSAPREEARIGAMDGRKYPKGVNQPDFIAPPAEPLLASLKKQEQMKAEIYELIDIAAANAVPTHASAESKQMDDRGLESGLSYIGLELEYAEREIAKIWAIYESGESATITYPAKYSLKSDGQRIDEAKALDEVKASAPSRTFAKEVGKQIVHVMLADKVPPEKIAKINTEIDDAEYISSDPTLIQTASELGMVDAVTGSNALGFNGEKVVPKAQEEHAKRLALIAESQASGAARGNPDAAPIQGKDAAAKAEKTASQKTPDLQPNPAQDKTRGPS